MKIDGVNKGINNILKYTSENKYGKVSDLYKRFGKEAVENITKNDVITLKSDTWKLSESHKKCLQKHNDLENSINKLLSMLGI